MEATRCGIGLTMYTVKEIYTTLQGEGAHTGRAAVFLRFPGCNLWSGLERDRGDGGLPVLRYGFRGSRWPGRRQFGEAGALANAVAQCWEAAVGSYPSPLPLSRKGRGVCAPPSSIAEKGTPSQPAHPAPSPSRERAGVRGGKG